MKTMGAATTLCPYCYDRSMDAVAGYGCGRCFGTGRMPLHIARILGHIRRSHVRHLGRASSLPAND